VVLGPFERGVAHFDQSDLLIRHLIERRPGDGRPTTGAAVAVGGNADSIHRFGEAGWVVNLFEADGATGQETHRLSAYLDSQDLDHVDYLKIDTEGRDLLVLRSFPWDTDSPDAIECGFSDYESIDRGYTSDDLANFLVEKGYQILVSEWHPIIRHDSSHDFLTLRRFEPDTISSSAWGNFLAVHSAEDADALIEHACARGVDIRERTEKPAAQRGVSTFPDEFPDSPSAIPLIAGAAERAGLPAPTTELEYPSMTSLPSNPVALAKQLVKFYLAPTGLVLAAALVLLAVSLIGFAFSWLFGLAGIALLGLYLPYKFAKVDERQYAQSNSLHDRVKAARIASDTARSGVGDVHDELRRSIERLDERIDRLDGN